MRQKTYRDTLHACYWGYITQAIINNLAPLLFVIFQTRFAISLTLIGQLILLNFGVQLLTDLFAIKFVDKVGYRFAVVLAQACSALGLILLAALPNLLPSPYAGLMLAVVIYAFGGGLIEVLISPIVNALPGDAKASAMSLLHSFYCWGQVAVVLVSTLALHFMGDGMWPLLPLLWALIPLYNLFLFLRVPLAPMVSAEEKTPLRRLFTSRIFVIAMLLMLCAGASELAMSQWSSLFAEKGLGVPKVMGDLLGPCLFAILMGLGRVFYGIWGHKLRLRRVLMCSALLCVACYLVTVFSPWPVLSLLSCALCGLSVSLMWPGMLSLTAERYPAGGTAMFGVLALMGDLGCALGPWLAGLISDTAQAAPRLMALGQTLGVAGEQLGLKCGLFAAAIFPLLMLGGLALMRGKQQA